MIKIEEVIKIHDTLVNRFGGIRGVRDYVIKIAQGQLNFEQINNWIAEKLRKL